MKRHNEFPVSSSKQMSKEKQIASIPCNDIQEFLHAAKEGNYEVCCKFIKNYPLLQNTITDIKDDKYGANALHWAAINGHLNIVILLTENFPFLINSLTNNYSTPILNAVVNNHLEVVTYLLKIKASGGLKNDMGLNIFNVKKSKDIQKIVDDLFKNINQHFLLALKENMPNEVKKLLEQGADGNRSVVDEKITYYNAVDYAFFKGYYEIASILINFSNKLRFEKPYANSPIVTIEQLNALANLIQEQNVKLTELTFLSQNIGDNGISILKNGLQKNRTLKKLGIIGDSITKNGLQALVNAIKFPLKELLLNRNHLTDETLYVLESLINHNELDTLGLTYNKISDNGAAFLAKLLKSNKSLLELNLSFNHITDDGIKELSASLKENKTLCSLSLVGNFVTNIGIDYLIDALEYNHNIVILNCFDKNNPSISKEKLEIVENKCKKNASLRISLNKIISAIACCNEIMSVLKENKKNNSIHLEVPSLSLIIKSYLIISYSSMVLIDAAKKLPLELSSELLSWVNFKSNVNESRYYYKTTQFFKLTKIQFADNVSSEEKYQLILNSR